MLCDFPKILSELRHEKGISQKKAAEALGISPALLSHYENGIRECGLDFVLNIAEFYNVSCDYLLGKSKVKRPGFYEYEPEAAALDSVLKIAVNHNDSVGRLLKQIASVDLYRMARALCDTASRSSVFAFDYDGKEYKDLCNAAGSILYSKLTALGHDRRKLQSSFDNYSKVISEAEKLIKNSTD